MILSNGLNVQQTVFLIHAMVCGDVDLAMRIGFMYFMDVIINPLNLLPGFFRLRAIMVKTAVVGGAVYEIGGLLPDTCERRAHDPFRTGRIAYTWRHGQPQGFQLAEVRRLCVNSDICVFSVHT